jgi:hypothetical protein
VCWCDGSETKSDFAVVVVAECGYVGPLDGFTLFAAFFFAVKRINKLWREKRFVIKKLMEVHDFVV